MQYQFGTVSVTNDNETVIGDSTVDWTELKTAVENGNPVFFSVYGSSEATYQVTSMTDPATSGSGFWELTLSAKYAGVTAVGAAYILHKDFTSKLGLPLFAYGDRQTAALMSRAMQTLDDKSHAMKNGLYLVTTEQDFAATLVEIGGLNVLPEGDKYYRLHYGLLFQTNDAASFPSFQFAWTADENVSYFAGIARAIQAAAGVGAEWQGALTKGSGVSNTLTMGGVLSLNTWYLLEIDAAFRVATYTGTLAPLLSLRMARGAGAGSIKIGAGSYLISTEFE